MDVQMYMEAVGQGGDIECKLVVVVAPVVGVVVAEVTVVGIEVVDVVVEAAVAAEPVDVLIVVVVVEAGCDSYLCSC